MVSLFNVKFFKELEKINLCEPSHIPWNVFHYSFFLINALSTCWFNRNITCKHQILNHIAISPVNLNWKIPATFATKLGLRAFSMSLKMAFTPVSTPLVALPLSAFIFSSWSLKSATESSRKKSKISGLPGIYSSLVTLWLFKAKALFWKNSCSWG